MIVNAAVFTCSICGEASTNICAYCTKDACSNHRCARCKYCSDCCECEVPLSAEEPEPIEAMNDAVIDAVPEPIAEFTEPETKSSLPDFLTPEERSVFAEEPIEEDHDDLTEPRDPAEPRP